MVSVLLFLTSQCHSPIQIRTIITVVINAVMGNQQGLTKSRAERGLAREVRMDFLEQVTFQCTGQVEMKFYFKYNRK